MRVIYICLVLCLLGGCAAHRLDAAHALKLHDHAESLYQAGNYTEALPLFQQLSHRFPRDSEFQLRIGNCYARQQHYEEAVTAYELAVAQTPDFSRAWYNLSYVRAQMLANTVVRMYEQLDPADPNVVQMRKWAADVLLPFGRLDGIDQLSIGDQKPNTVTANPTDEAPTSISSASTTQDTNAARDADVIHDAKVSDDTNKADGNDLDTGQQP